MTAPTAPPLRLLLLGGTTESLELAERLRDEPRLEVVTSLAGRTVAHRLPPGRVRVGGFGGAAGLAGFLCTERIGLVVDATHPFAATISAHAALACADAGVPRLQVQRPAWSREAGDRWIEVSDMAAAAAALPGLGHRVFLAIGRQELAAFAALPDHHLIARMVEAPVEPLPLADVELILARGPYSEAGERALYLRHGIDVVVSKNSGGAATYAKIAAARACGLPVVMVKRPALQPGCGADTVEAALAWVNACVLRYFAGRTPAS